MVTRWSVIAAHMPGRTDNEIKNYWNTHLRKQLLQMGIDPITHKLRHKAASGGSAAVYNQMAIWETARMQAESRLAREYLSFMSRKQPLKDKGAANNEQIFAEWLQEYCRTFGKYLHNDVVVPDVNNGAWQSSSGLLDAQQLHSYVPSTPSGEQQQQQQVSESSFTSSECSALPQLSEQHEVSRASMQEEGVGIGSDEFGVPGSRILQGTTMLEDISSSSSFPPVEFTKLGTTQGGDADAASNCQIPSFVTSPFPQLETSSLAEDDALDMPAELTGSDMDLLELTRTDNMPSNADYWSTILRIVGT